MADDSNPNGAQHDVTELEEASAQGRRPYEPPKLVSGDIFERIMLGSPTSDAPGVPGC